MESYKYTKLRINPLQSTALHSLYGCPYPALDSPYTDGATVYQHLPETAFGTPLFYAADSD